MMSGQPECAARVRVTTAVVVWHGVQVSTKTRVLAASRRASAEVASFISKAAGLHIQKTGAHPGLGEGRRRSWEPHGGHKVQRCLEVAAAQAIGCLAGGSCTDHEHAPQAEETQGQSARA